MNDQAVIQVYAAMLQARSCSVSVDGILVDPDLRSQFISQCHLLLGDIPERQILKALLNLRKRRRLPRQSDGHCSAN